jgi:hypothetical protein
MGLDCIHWVKPKSRQIYSGQAQMPRRATFNLTQKWTNEAQIKSAFQRETKQIEAAFQRETKQIKAAFQRETKHRLPEVLGHEKSRRFG